MTWVFPAEGQLAAHGLAVVRPLALDLAMLASTFNGNWDRDNVGPLKIDATKGSTIRTPFASKFTRGQPLVVPGSPFALSGSGRLYLTGNGTGVDMTIETQDSRLIITWMLTLRLDASAIAAPAAAGPSFLPVSVACGIEVDGRMAWWTGWETVSVEWDGAGVGGEHVDVSFARAKVTMDVGAGSHYIAVFLDYWRHIALDVNANVELEAEVLERCLFVEEVRR